MFPRPSRVFLALLMFKKTPQEPGDIRRAPAGSRQEERELGTPCNALRAGGAGIIAPGQATGLWN